jgi:hypothetical protein
MCLFACVGQVIRRVVCIIVIKCTSEQSIFLSCYLISATKQQKRNNLLPRTRSNMQFHAVFPNSNDSFIRCSRDIGFDIVHCSGPVSKAYKRISWTLQCVIFHTDL